VSPENAIRGAILRGFASAKYLHSRPALVVHLQAGLAHVRGLQAAQKERLTQSLRQGYRDALLAVQVELPASVAKRDATIDAKLDVTHPRAIRWIEQHAAALADFLDISMQAAVENIVRRMFTEHIPVDRAARLIADIIGLDARFGNAVANFEAGLVEEGRDPTQVARLVETYADRLRGARARAIARTESIKASVEGQKAIWQRAVETGILDPSRTKRGWIVAADERLCAVCAPIPSQGAVGLDEPFIDGAGNPTDGPPIHVNCRCALKLVFEKPDGSYPEAPAPAEAYAGGSPPRRSLRPKVPRQVLS